MWAVARGAVCRESHVVKRRARVSQRSSAEGAGDSGLMEFAPAASAKQKPPECLTTVLLRERIARLAGQAQEDAQSSESVARGAVCLQALPKRLRWDAPPVVQDPRTGSRDMKMRVAADPGQVATALTSLNALMYTPRSKLSKDGRRRFWVEMCEAARRQPFPLDALRVTFGAAVFRAARYRSARLYLVEAKIEHERRGFEVTPMLQHAITDAVRPSSVAWGQRERQAKFDLRF